MFVLDEKVVYPGHGVAKINRIVSRKVAGHDLKFFELRFLSKDMTILVPTHNLASVGVRRLCSSSGIDKIFKILKEPAQDQPDDPNANNWNKRNKDYQCKLRSGDLGEICKIYRDLQHISATKELSFGEKNLLQETENLLAQEISLVRSVDKVDAAKQLRAFF